MSATASTTSKTRKTRSNGKGGNGTAKKTGTARKTTTDKPAVKKVEGHGKPQTLENGNVIYNDDRPIGKSGKGGVVVKHGTSTGYQRGCRCDECKAAMADYTKGRRDANGEAAKAAEEKKATAKAKRQEKATAKKAAEAEAKGNDKAAA